MRKSAAPKNMHVLQKCKQKKSLFFGAINTLYLCMKSEYHQNGSVLESDL